MLTYDIIGYLQLRIIHLPDHVEVAALAENHNLRTNVSMVDVLPIEYFTVSVPTGDGDTYVISFLLVCRVLPILTAF